MGQKGVIKSIHDIFLFYASINNIDENVIKHALKAIGVLSILVENSIILMDCGFFSLLNKIPSKS